MTSAESEAARAGYDAYWRGDHLHHNPHPVGSALWRAWKQGWFAEHLD